MAIERYNADGFSVTYDPDICTHAGRCVKGLPNVFDAKRKPWVDVGAASADEIERQVAKCPSRALAFVRDEA